MPTEFIKGFKQFFKGNAPKICHAGELYVAINPEGKLLACGKCLGFRGLEENEVCNKGGQKDLYEMVVTSDKLICF